jgi:hypothetical protein
MPARRHDPTQPPRKRPLTSAPPLAPPFSRKRPRSNQSHHGLRVADHESPNFYSIHLADRKSTNSNTLNESPKPTRYSVHGFAFSPITTHQSPITNHGFQMAKLKLIATTPKLKIAVISRRQTTSQKLIATKTALPVRRAFAQAQLRRVRPEGW